jgi:uncharacterized sulfatase
MLAAAWFATLIVPFISGTARAEDRPNILWLSCEDISPHLGCYGYPLATTPRLDRLAAEGTRYENAFVCAGVCAPCRSTIITGMYQTTIGTHHMRCNARLPDHIEPFPMYLREAGYYCTNNAKQDYQFKTPSGTWDESSNKAHWKNRPEGAPFFAVFNYTGCHESGIAGDGKYKRVTEGLEKHDRRAVAEESLPPYYPDTPVVREDWGRYYDVITAMDRWVAERLAELDEAGLADETVVIFWSDHGVGLPRAKRWLYDSGMRVPVIVRMPEKYRVGDQGKPDSVSDQMISLMDLGPTTMNLAGVAIPETMQGRPFLGPNLPEPRQYVFGARDRMDERYDIIRAVRDKRYKYLRNYQPYKTYYQYMNTPEKGRTMQEIRRVQKEGTASPGVAKFLVPNKPIEELYDTVADPHEMNNLADDPQYGDVLRRMREAHLDWVARTRDIGLMPEAEINAREEKVGSAWAILNARDDAIAYMDRIRMASSLSLEGDEALPEMQSLLDDSDAVVRYWACVGIGNLGEQASEVGDQVKPLLDDESANVRVAAARALAAMGRHAEAFPTLVEVLDDGTQWARLHAAIVLDEMDQEAMPLVEAMKRNKAYRDGMVARGKYTVRVLNRALNEMLGTNNTVR